MYKNFLFSMLDGLIAGDEAAKLDAVALFAVLGEILDTTDPAKTIEWCALARRVIDNFRKLSEMEKR